MPVWKLHYRKRIRTAGLQVECIQYKPRIPEYTVLCQFCGIRLHHIRQLADAQGLDVRPMSWAFVFPVNAVLKVPGIPARGIDKPILNLFRMYALMGDTKIGFVSSAAVDINEFLSHIKGINNRR